MSQNATEQQPGPEPAVRELARDPASRKRFLKLAGAGAAGALGAFIAACGDSDDEKASTGTGTTASEPPRATWRSSTTR